MTLTDPGRRMPEPQEPADKKIRVLRRSLVQVRWSKGGIPRLVLHERYERPIKWTLHGLTALGVLSSVVTLPRLWALGLSILMLLIDRFLVRTLFLFTSLYVQPLPAFKLDNDKWLGMAYGMLPVDDPRKVIPVVGPIFTDPEYARRFFELLLAWNRNEPFDGENNINVSFVTDEDRYYVFFYPNLRHPDPTRAFKQIEEENKLSKYGKEHFGLTAALFISKTFRVDEGYGVGRFAENVPQGRVFLLAPFTMDDAGQPQMATNLGMIQKRHFKAKHRSELTNEDIEFFHIRLYYNE